VARLQDAAPAERWPAIETVLIEELGPDRAVEVDPVPLAAASIGQAHAGVLQGGTEVVVKVRRPGLHDSAGRNLANAAAALRASSDDPPGYDRGSGGSPGDTRGCLREQQKQRGADCCA
jgi:predicted unusual protein kinase regulating ubiquinone biosynthesis (AarF/ABC1/UbiB family)